MTIKDVVRKTGALYVGVVPETESDVDRHYDESCKVRSYEYDKADNALYLYIEKPSHVIVVNGKNFMYFTDIKSCNKAFKRYCRGNETIINTSNSCVAQV